MDFRPLGAGAAMLLIACSPSANVDPGSGAGSDAGAASVDATTDGGTAPPTCVLSRKFVETCNGELTCGASGFDAWCRANDAVVNSDAFRRAEATCLPQSTCSSDARHDCEYRQYATEKATDAQRALVQAYCQKCEATDVAGCVTRSTTYDPANGPSKVGDIFVAAWELSDPLCDSIRTKCLSAEPLAADAGASSCIEDFATCAGGVYLDAVPTCP